MGIVQIGKMLPTLTQVLGLQRFTNNSNRPSSIRAMKRTGASDREIATVSGHVDPNSLAHYAPNLDDERAFEMAMSISNAGGKHKIAPSCPPISAKSNNVSKYIYYIYFS